MLINSKNIVLLSYNKKNTEKVRQLLVEIFNYGEVEFGYNDIYLPATLIKETIDNQPDKLFTGKMLFILLSPVSFEEFDRGSEKMQSIVEQFFTEKDFKFLYVTDQPIKEEKENVINIKDLNTNEIFHLIADKYKDEINIYSAKKILSLYYLKSELN